MIIKVVHHKGLRKLKKAWLPEINFVHLGID